MLEELVTKARSSPDLSAYRTCPVPGTPTCTAAFTGTLDQNHSYLCRKSIYFLAQVYNLVHRDRGAFSSALLTALGSVASVHPKHSRDTNAYLEDVLRKSRADTCDLLDAIGTGFLLFLVSQRWQSAWIDAIPRNLEVRRPNCLLDFCRESRFDSVWKRQVENLHPYLGRSLCVCHLHDSHVGDGLGCLVPVPQVSGNRVLPGPWTVTSNPGTCQLLSGPRSLFPSHLA